MSTLSALSLRSGAKAQLAAVFCSAAVKLSSRGDLSDASAASSIVCRIKLYANRPVQISLRTISGDWQRKTSNAMLHLMARISNSTNQRRRYKSAKSSRV